MHVQLIRADITSMKVDAMVNPSASEEDPVAAGNLLCRFIIPAVVPEIGSEDSEMRLRNSTQRALERAEGLAVASVALPALWTAPPEAVDRCAEIMLDVTLDFASRARSLQRVVYCLFNESVYEAFDRVLQRSRQH
jgi:O-acetyl-ADP-ribose deacetylase (regulator of RNase III)